MKVTWTVKSFKVNQKTPSASDASSTSNKCNSGSRVISSHTGAEETFTDDTFMAYPNPALNSVVISGNIPFAEKDVVLLDIIGKQYPVKAIQNSPGKGLEIDLTGLRSGLYLVRITTGNRQHVLRIIKQ